MKPLFTVFIFTIFLEIKGTYSIQEIGGVVIDVDENGNDGLRNTFRKVYGDYMVEISRLDSEQIASMIPHLEAIVIAAEGNALGTVFNYVKELCAEHAKLKSLNRITNNVGDFVAKSGYRTKSGEKSSVKSDAAEARFSATSVDAKNVDEIKAAFDNIDPHSKRENALKDQDEKLKAAEKKRAEATAKVEADAKKAEDEYELAQRKAQRECDEAYAAAEETCKSAVKKSEDDSQKAEKEYEEAKERAEEELRRANDDYETITKAAEEDYREAVATAKENLDEAEEDYDAALKKGEKARDDAYRRADARRQISADQYEAALNGRLTDKIRNTIEKSMNRAEIAYQQALNRANSEWDKVQADALKEWTNAQREYEEAKMAAENEANTTFVEAETMKQKASEERDKTVGRAQTELYAKQQAADQRMQIACQQKRYEAAAKADEAHDQATRRLKKRWVETQNLAAQNFEKIEHEYREEVEKITQEYHDACNGADALQERVDKMTTSRREAAKKTSKNGYGQAKKKRQQKSRSTLKS